MRRGIHPPAALLNAETAQLASAGKWQAAPGSGPRTLHFHPNGTTAYCMNELASAVDVLTWNKSDGTLTTVTRVELNPDRSKPTSTGCDTVITRDGRFVYFANRGDDVPDSSRAASKTRTSPADQLFGWPRLKRMVPHLH